MKNIAFLFSGRGTLLQPICTGLNKIACKAAVTLVITNNSNFNIESFDLPDGCDFYCLDHRNYTDRSDHEREIANLLRKYKINLIVLGGYRRIFSKEFVAEFGQKTINTHPSLLPSFVGDKAQLQAIERGVKITGTTVHFINDEVDQGPIIMQAAVEVDPSFSESDLKDAIVNMDKLLLPRTVKLFLENKLIINGNRVLVKPGCEDEIFMQ